ncbi:MAG: dTDP-4-dehydrorhamnose reductase [Acidobacteria bacterium]|nr:dTDP-4-dehydrorhamnose reductase [Acidobacteriota bacterium]
MKVLITGANGMVARAAIEYCRSIGDEVTALTRRQLDISSRSSVDTAFEKFGPEIVLNCAAYTDVDGAESNEEVAYRANAVGVENLAAACAKHSAVFITISTDYVFDGAKDDLYSASDTPNPRGIYARSKLEGELLAAAANPNSIIVRSGWIYGHGGTNFLSVMHKLLADGKRIKAIRDSFGTPTFADDLAKRLRDMASSDRKDIIHVTNLGSGTSYLGFAEKLCEIGGYDSDLLESVNNDDLKRPAPRPSNSRLENTEIAGLPPMPYWDDALYRFIKSER